MPQLTTCAVAALLLWAGTLAVATPESATADQESSFKAKAAAPPPDVQRPDANNIAAAGIKASFPGAGDGTGTGNPAYTSASPASALFPAGRRLLQTNMVTAGGRGSSRDARVSVDIDDASREVIATNQAQSALQQRPNQVQLAPAPAPFALSDSPSVDLASRPFAISSSTSSSGRRLRQLVSRGDARVTIPENVATIDLSSEDLQRVRSSSVSSSQQASKPQDSVQHAAAAGGAAGRKLQQGQTSGTTVGVGASGSSTPGHVSTECLGGSKPYANCGLVPNPPATKENSPVTQPAAGRSVGQSVGVSGRRMLQDGTAQALQIDPSGPLQRLLTQLLPQASPGAVQLSTSSNPKYDLSLPSTAGRAAAPSPH